MTSDITMGLIETAEAVSHDPDEQDWYEVEEYLDLIPDAAKVLRELVRFMHAEFL